MTGKQLRARYEGIQESLCPGLPHFALWTLWEALPGHPYGSTVSDSTIRALGYCPIDTPEARPCRA